MDHIIIKELNCEYEVDPLGIDVATPRFGWVLDSCQRGQRQTAYHLIVADKLDALASDRGNLFDSGKVESDQSLHVAYQGKRLISGGTYFWKVRCWDQDGRCGPWSKPACFEMGLLDPGDWQGEWIGGANSISSPLLRKEFEIESDIQRGRVYISGLGCYEIYINGRRIGDRVLDPATTDYDKRILYPTYDVTNLLRRGKNVLGVWLGNGFYCQPSQANLTDAVHAYGDSPRLLMQMNLVLAEGRTMKIKTDETWKVFAGPITFNSIVGGEVYDARLEKTGWSESDFDDSDWPNVVIKKHPGGRLESQRISPIMVNKIIKPVSLSEPKPGVYVYDLGQSFGGWLRLRVRGPRDTRIALIHGEFLRADGLVEKGPYPGTLETDFYILKGTGQEIYEPRFTFHPIRYVQIEGWPGEPELNDIEGRAVYSAVDLSGDFECSNSLFNRIHQNVMWTLTNSLYGMPMDCLHREPAAYLDPASVAGTLFTRKFMPTFWIKWLRDIQLAQKDGVISDVSPNFRELYPGDPWCVSYCILVWYVYQSYGDIRILEDHYSGMKAWLEYLGSLAQGHIITKGHYGDHMVPGKSPGEEEFLSGETPAEVIWTASYYRGVKILADAARVLGKINEAGAMTELAEKIAEAFNARWLDRQAGYYGTGAQTTNLFPLTMGMVPKKYVKSVTACIKKSIVEKYGGHLHTGNVGTICLIEVLAEEGLGSVLFDVVAADTYPGWGYMVKNGATTIWESWGRFQPKNPRWRADSMMMWATVAEFFYKDLAGIRGPGFYRESVMTPGFQEVQIRPYILGNLTFARASVKTVRGMIASAWRREGKTLIVEVSIPVNATGKVSIPKMGNPNVRIEESEKVIWKDHAFMEGVSGITDGIEGAEYVVLNVGSGVYRFTSI
jgi:alpha-L-rhamnosidase